MFGMEAARLYVGVGVDGMSQLEKDMDKAGALVDKIGNAHASITVSADTNTAQSKIDDLLAHYEAIGGNAKHLMLAVDSNPAKRAIGEIELAVDRLRGKLHSLATGGTFGTFGQDLAGGTGLKAAIGNVASKIGGGMATGGFGGGIQAGLGALGVGGVAIAGAAALGGFALMKAGEQEKFETQLSVLLGGVDKAKERIADLTKFAQTTPFELPGVVQASKTLQVFTGDALSTGEGLRLVGDVAAGTGSDLNETAMWFGRMYDAMKSGRPFGEATQRLQEMGAIGGKDREMIESLASKVKDGSMTMEQAWGQATGAFSRFSGMMDKQSQTFEGKLSNLQDSIGQLGAKIGGYLLPVAKVIVDTFITFFNVLSGMIQVLADGVEWVAKLAGEFVKWVASMPFVQDAIKVISGALGVLGDAVDFVSGIIGQAWDDVTGKTEQLAAANKTQMEMLNSDWHKTFREGERDISDKAKVMFTPIPFELDKARKRAIEIAKQTPVDIANALRDKRTAWQKAVDDLKYDLEHSMSVAAETAAIKAEIAAIKASEGWKSGDPVLIAALNGTLQTLQTRLDELSPMANKAGKAALDSLGKILKSDPTPANASKLQVDKIEAIFLGMPGYEWAAALLEQWKAGAEAAQGKVNHAVLMTTTKIELIKNLDSEAWGEKLVTNYAKGLKAGIPAVTHNLLMISSKVANLLKLSSPAKEGPLSEGGGPEGWGARGAMLYSKGWASWDAEAMVKLAERLAPKEHTGSSGMRWKPADRTQIEDRRHANAEDVMARQGPRRGYVDPRSLHLEIHNIDARGTADPEATRRAVRKGIMDAVAEGFRQQNARLPAAAI